MRALNKDTENDCARDLKSLFEAYFDDLFIYAKTITNSTDLAKDAVSEVFFDLIRSNRELDQIRDVKAYLFKSVKNGCIKLLSRDPIQFEYLQEEKEFQLIEEIDPEEIMMGKELEAFLNETIDQLSPQCQLVFKMVRIENRKYEDVASELGISVNTTRNHLVAATKYLRTQLENHYSKGTIIKLIKNLGVIAIGCSLILRYI